MREGKKIIYCRSGHHIGWVPERLSTSITNSHMRQVMEQAEVEEFSRLRFCTECGAESVCDCEFCEAVLGEPSRRPSYCGSCGKPFPWTDTAIAAAREYTDELAGLSLEDKTDLKATLTDLTFDTARTPLAASRFKRIMSKLTPAVGETFQKIIVDVITDTAKKVIKGG